MEMIKTAQSLYTTVLSTEIHRRYGLHQIGEAIEYYLKNQTAGKIVIVPSLTNSAEPETQTVNINERVAKL